LEKAILNYFFKLGLISSLSATALGCSSKIFHKKSGPLLSQEKNFLPPDDSSFEERQQKLDSITFSLDPPPGQYDFAPLVTVSSLENAGIGAEFIQARAPHEKNFVQGTAQKVKVLARKSGLLEYQAVVAHLSKTQKSPLLTAEYGINLQAPVPFFNVTEDDGETESELKAGRELKTVCMIDSADTWRISVVTALDELFGDRFAQVEINLIEPVVENPMVIGKETGNHVGVQFHPKSTVYLPEIPLTYSTRLGSSPPNLGSGACEVKFESLQNNGLTKGTISCKKLPKDQPQKQSESSITGGVATDIADSILDSIGADEAVETDPVFLPLGPVATFHFDFQCDAYQDF
jgi:hypothetical protein